MTDLPIPHRFWVQAHGGHAVDLMSPRPTHFKIESIAHQLSQICRFAGATRTHYSVAQHSVHVAEFVPLSFARRALFHDAHEVLTSDIPGPFLALLTYHLNGARTPIDYYVDLYRRAVAEAFHVDFPLMCPEVVRADFLMLAAEKRDLLGPEPQPWPGLHRVDAKALTAVPKITPWPAEVARARFLDMFDALGGSHG